MNKVILTKATALSVARSIVIGWNIISKPFKDILNRREDLVTSSKDKPEMREMAQELLDKQRNIRKVIDELRIQEKAQERLHQTV